MTPPVPAPAGEAPHGPWYVLGPGPWVSVIHAHGRSVVLHGMAEAEAVRDALNRVASGAPGRDAPSEESDIERLVRSAAERGQLVHLDAGLLLDLFRQLRASRGLPAAPPEEPPPPKPRPMTSEVKAALMMAADALTELKGGFCWCREQPHTAACDDAGEALGAIRIVLAAGARTALGEGRPE